MINFALAYRANPLDEEADKKYYAVAQYSTIMDLPQFAKHISSHGCVYSRADIQAVLTLAVDCIREQLLLGQRIKLGELGTFYVSLSGKGKLHAADYDPYTCVREVNVGFTPGIQFQNLKSEAEFHQVPTREVQAALLKAVNGDKSDPSGAKKPETVVTITKQ